MCIYKGIIKLIRIKRQFKSTLNSQKFKFRQISYTVNTIRLQYFEICFSNHTNLMYQGTETLLILQANNILQMKIIGII